MPELPEVETIRRGLRRRVLRRRILRVEVLEPRLRIRIAADFAERLTGRRIDDVRRRAKYLQFHLDDGRVWIVHLGMSGKLIHVDPTRPREKHDHVIVHLDEGQLRFNDPRRFGLCVLLDGDESAAWPSFRNLGPDPFDPSFDGNHLFRGTHASRRTIKDILMDQSVVAGLGNIYVNEVLFRAGVRPTARGVRITRAAADRIAALVPELLREAIRWCGTSFSDYRDGEDRAGRFQAQLRVYQREGQPCRACGALVRRIVSGNRSSFYCPNCQR